MPLGSRAFGLQCLGFTLMHRGMAPAAHSESRSLRTPSKGVAVHWPPPTQPSFWGESRMIETASATTSGGNPIFASSRRALPSEQGPALSL